MNRRIALFLAALVVPGGFIALFGAFLFRAFSRTDMGQKAILYAKARVPFGRRLELLAPVRQAA